jgi:uncharacterized protein
VYADDGIEYSSGVDRSADVCSIQTDCEPLEHIFNSDESIILVTYSSDKKFQQTNPIEAAISRRLVASHRDELTAGIVTPHNSQRSRLRSMLYEMSNGDDGHDGIMLDENTFVETVERYQGGQEDLMIVSATVSDPRYIDSENEFLLEQNRANVSFTRHKNKLVVVAPKTLFSHIPDEPEIYDESELWKSLSIVSGEAPHNQSSPPVWRGSLTQLLDGVKLNSQVGSDNVPIEIYSVGLDDLSIL